jgi:hypothetical protein
VLNQAGRQYDDVMQRSFVLSAFCWHYHASSIFRSTGCKVLGMKIAQTLGVLLFSAARGHYLSASFASCFTFDHGRRKRFHLSRRRLRLELYSINVTTGKDSLVRILFFLYG